MRFQPPAHCLRISVCTHKEGFSTLGAESFPTSARKRKIGLAAYEVSNRSPANKFAAIRAQNLPSQVKNLVDEGRLAAVGGMSMPGFEENIDKIAHDVYALFSDMWESMRIVTITHSAQGTSAEFGPGLVVGVLLGILAWRMRLNILDLAVDNIAIELPGIGNVDLKVDKADRLAAWQIYVDMTTRVAVAELAPGDGILREALESLHTLFANTRDVLKAGSPRRETDGRNLETVSLELLNKHLRTFLAKWHPRLSKYEASLKAGESAAAHEEDWPENAAFRDELKALQVVLAQYARELARIAGISQASGNL
jgi:hypothetical protein